MKGLLIILAIGFIGTVSTESFAECKDKEWSRNIPYPGNCEKFITCLSNGDGILRQCPEPLHFNAAKEVCDWPERAGCDYTNKEVKPQFYHGDIRPECRGIEIGRNMPFYGNCTRFVSCIGIGTVMECPYNLHFNAKLEICDRPEDAGCIWDESDY